MSDELMELRGLLINATMSLHSMYSASTWAEKIKFLHTHDDNHTKIIQLFDTLTTRTEKAERELHDIISLCQRYQPPGSPPPGDRETFVWYILQSLHEEVSTAKRALAEATKGSHD